MDDLISRSAAIEAIEEVDWYHQNKNKDMVHGANSSEDQAWYKADDIYKTLEALPSARQWIPCSKRLPEEENKYLCTCSSDEDDEMFVLSFHKNLYAYDRYVFEQYRGTVHPGFIIYDSIYGDAEVDVLAWMPLPEPYAGRRTDE